MGSGVPNVVFILTDQERYFPELPAGYSLPGRQRLQELGTTFTNHQITSNVCTPSRSTVYSGEHIQRTGVFDNVNFPWARDLPLSMPTIGHRMRDLGYYSAYLGKWHLSRQLDTTDVYGGPNPEFGDVMDAYGFSDFVGPGDVIGMTQGGYRSDEMIGAITRHWLRTRAEDLAASNKPWFLAVNLVNPHDVMFFNTDVPGEPVQGAVDTIAPLAFAPPDPIYQATWDMPLPTTRHEPWDAPGRPAAHREYQEARRWMVGMIPDEDARWQRLQDYYLNCIRDSDRQIEAVLNELDHHRFLDDAVVIQTSDHGELGGAHGMSGKGATAYRQQNNVPLLIKHPDIDGGTTCDSITSHVDLVPTIIGCATGDGGSVDDLPGRNLAAHLPTAGSLKPTSIRDGALYAYNMFLWLDADFLAAYTRLLAAGTAPDAPPPAPDFNKRGAIRSVTNGHHRFTRYFSPLQHHRPETIDELLSNNDLELFDLHNNPDETLNLAADPVSSEAKLLEMNGLMNQLIDDEVGIDDGSFLPDPDSIPWIIDRWDL